MITKFRFLFMCFGLFLCVNVFAQTSTYLKGTIQFKTGERLQGFTALMNDTTVFFKFSLDNELPTSINAKDVLGFKYDNKNYKAIDYNNSTFFVHELEKGRIKLYKHEFAKNENQAFFIETPEEILNISSSNYYTILMKYMNDVSIFEQYDKDLFLFLYAYNEAGLSRFINYYNQCVVDILSISQNSDKGRIFYNNSNNPIAIPNTARNKLVLKTEVLYNQILEALKEDNWKKINTALELMKPLGQEIESYGNNKLYQQLLLDAKEQKNEKFKKTFIHFVAVGLQSLIKTAHLQEKAEVRKVIVRQSFIEFLEIKTELQKINATLTNQINTQFKTIFANAETQKQFEIEVTKISNSFKKVVSNI